MQLGYGTRSKDLSQEDTAGALEKIRRRSKDLSPDDTAGALQAIRRRSKELTGLAAGGGAWTGRNGALYVMVHHFMVRYI